MANPNETNQDNADTPKCLHCEKYSKLVNRLGSELQVKNLILERARVQQAESIEAAHAEAESARFVSVAQLICLVVLVYIAWQFFKLAPFN